MSGDGCQVRSCSQRRSGSRTSLWLNLASGMPKADIYEEALDMILHKCSRRIVAETCERGRPLADIAGLRNPGRWSSWSANNEHRKDHLACVTGWYEAEVRPLRRRSGARWLKAWSILSTTVHQLVPEHRSATTRRE